MSRRRCDACRMARLVEKGVIAQIGESGHSDCVGSGGGCECKCGYARMTRCAECGRLREAYLLSDGDRPVCLERADCARAILDGTAVVASPRPPKASERASETVEALTCRCGCGQPVKRRFVSGHDGRLAGRLIRAARAGDRAALAELEELGWTGKLQNRLAAE